MTPPRRRLQHQQGFTLIELLIVIFIVGLLASVMLPNFLGAQKRAYDAAAAGCANDIAKKEGIFLVDYNRFGTWDELNAQPGLVPNCPLSDVIVTEVDAPTQTDFKFTVKHKSGIKTYTVERVGITSTSS